MQVKSDRKLPVAWLFGAIAFVVLACWLGVWIFLPRFYPPDKAGLLGDSFGVVNSLFSGLTLLGAVYAVYAQSVQLRLARQQIEDNKRLTVISCLIQARTSLVENSYDRLLDMRAKFSKDETSLDPTRVKHRMDVLHPFQSDYGHHVAELKLLVKHAEEQIGWVGYKSETAVTARNERTSATGDNS